MHPAPNKPALILINSDCRKSVLMCPSPQLTFLLSLPFYFLIGDNRESIQKSLDEFLYQADSSCLFVEPDKVNRGTTRKNKKIGEEQKRE